MRMKIFFDRKKYSLTVRIKSTQKLYFRRSNIKNRSNDSNYVLILLSRSIPLTQKKDNPDEFNQEDHDCYHQQKMVTDILK